MPKDFSYVTDPVMVYNSSNQYTVIEATQLDDALALGWTMQRPGDIHTQPLEFTGDPFAGTPPQPQDELASMTKADLIQLAKDVHGLEVSDKLTKAQIVEKINNPPTE